jgi:hypothetical protein
MMEGNAPSAPCIRTARLCGAFRRIGLALLADGADDGLEPEQGQQDSEQYRGQQDPRPAIAPAGSRSRVPVVHKALLNHGWTRINTDRKNPQAGRAECPHSAAHYSARDRRGGDTAPCLLPSGINPIPDSLRGNPCQSVLIRGSKEVSRSGVRGVASSRRAFGSIAPAGFPELCKSGRGVLAWIPPPSGRQRARKDQYS